MLKRKNLTKNHGGVYSMKDEPSWFSRQVSSVKGWFISNDADNSEKQPENVSEEKKDEPSWFSRQVSSVKGWFSSDEGKNNE